MEPIVAGEANASRGGDYPTLIRAAMRQRGVSKSDLFDAGAIRKCTFRNFGKRLADGTVYFWELAAVLKHLQIEPIRATLAVDGLQNPDEYFETTCEVAAIIARELVTSLTQQMTAIEGSFSPIKDSLYKALAQKHASDIISRNLRLMEMQAREFGGDH